MPIALYDTLPNSVPNYQLADKTELGQQKRLFERQLTANGMVGNKRLFLGRFDGRVELKVYQSTGSHAQQCISPNMIDLELEFIEFFVSDPRSVNERC
jgi:hypothetical protein